jgi:hypothetical protein
MALSGYPKTYDHPKIHEIHEGVPAASELSGGTYWLIKSMGDLSTNWIEYKLKYPTSDDPTEEHTIRVTCGTTLQGPFSYVKHNDEGLSGASGSAQDCYSLVYEVED